MLLKNYPITHGGIRPVHHSGLGVQVNGQTCIRYMRFLKPVRIDRLELGLISGTEDKPMGGSGRWVPDIPTHPAHLIVSVLEKRTCRWRTVKEIDLPANPVIGGKGLSQEMTTDDITRILEEAKEKTMHIIALGGLRTDHLRVECDREHAVWPSHGECNGGILNVPFSILNPLQAFGEIESSPNVLPNHTPLLKHRKIDPRAPMGMTVSDRPEMLLYQGERLSVGFSLRRPMLMHLGWDFFGRGHACRNRLVKSLRINRGLFHQDASSFTLPAGLSGPLLRTLSSDYGAHRWTGEVSVEGNRISYLNLHVFDGLTVDAVFVVEPERLMLELRHRCDRDMPVLEFEAWRLAWDIRTGITGAAAMPTLLPGRNGDVKLPMHWAASGIGSLSCRLVEGDEYYTRMQVESYRSSNTIAGGLYLGTHADLNSCMRIPAGEHRARFELAVTILGPDTVKDTRETPIGVATCWPAPFSCFRPELAGFSDHSVSVNCHMSQSDVIEVIVFTRKPDAGPDPLELARFTIARALMDGPGYGYFRDFYMDTDPALVIAAGRLHHISPDKAWLRKVEPGLLNAVSRMLATLDEDGLVRSRVLSGNTGSYRWSTNAMDVIGFGHQDAYVNALSYRAFRNSAAMLADIAHPGLAERCRESAAGILAAYAKTFLNPETGWVAGWKSRDGQLHDYAFTYVNGPAIALGLLEENLARTALVNLEKLREAQGLKSARLGLPLNLLPIDPGDHILALSAGGLVPTFEDYIDGALTGCNNYYLRALSIYGLKENARSLALESNDAYAWGIFDGGNGSGAEFHSWEGMCNGYEGTMGNYPFASLYAIAVELGALKPLEPEWWPPGG